MIPAQRQRDLQIGTDAPFVLAVKANSIYCDGLRGTVREVLYIADSFSVVEARQILSLAIPDRANARPGRHFRSSGAAQRVTQPAIAGLMRARR